MSYFLYRTSASGEPFERTLAALVARMDVETHLLFSLRDDALHRLAALQLRLPGVLDTMLELRHLDEAAVREAIEKPVTEVWNRRHAPPVTVDPDFAHTLIEELRPRDDQGQPPAATALRTTTLTNRLQGVHAIASRHVDQVMNEIPAVDRALCASAFDRLVTPSGGKILYRTGDLATLAKVAPEVMDRVLETLGSGRNRLLRPVELPGARAHGSAVDYGRRGYEIVHDVLAGPILAWKDAYVRELGREAAARVATERAEEQTRSRYAKRVQRTNVAL